MLVADLPPVPAWRLEIRRTALDSTAKLVALGLSTFMDGAGRAEVSRRTLAEACSIEHVLTITRAIRRLELEGLLGVDRGGHEQHRSSRYQIRFRGSGSATPDDLRGSVGDTPGGIQGATGPRSGGYQTDHKNLRSSEVQSRAGAGAREAELELRSQGQERGEGYGDPERAALASEAAARARRILAGELELEGEGER